MTLEEAYKTLGIQNHFVSSDDLREYYEVKLSQVHGFNKEKQIKKIKLANQMIRNYRGVNNWVGSKSPERVNQFENAVKPPEKKESFLNVLRNLFAILGVCFLFLIIYSLFFR